jgi:hypothetical protein
MQLDLRVNRLAPASGLFPVARILRDQCRPPRLIEVSPRAFRHRSRPSRLIPRISGEGSLSDPAAKGRALMTASDS